MFGTSRKQQNPTPTGAEGEPAPSVKDEAARILALAITEANWARARAQKRTRVVGVHGTDFEARDARVELIVEKFNVRAVKTARKNALRAGWTKTQLAEAGLDGLNDSAVVPS